MQHSVRETLMSDLEKTKAKYRKNQDIMSLTESVYKSCAYLMLQQTVTDLIYISTKLLD